MHMRASQALGQWPVASGQWRVASGEWLSHLAFGAWRMAHGDEWTKLELHGSSMRQREKSI